MTSLQQVQTVLDGRVPDRAPVCLHNFLLAAREANISLNQYLTDPSATARAHLHALEIYQHDCILIDLDTTLLAEAMGAARDSTPNEPGHIAAPAINSLDEVDQLRCVDPQRDGRLPVLLEAIRILSEEIGDKIAIRGNCDQCAFSLAGLLRGMETFMIDLMETPDHPAIARLLDVAYESHLAVHRAAKAAGAHFTSLGDSPAGPDVVSPDIFRRFAKPYHLRLLRDVNWPVAIHICGNTSAILDQLAEYPDHAAFELDYKTDARAAKTIVGARHVLLGNVDPSGVIARGTVEQVAARTRELIDLWKPRGRFILNAGCAIPATTPRENLGAFMTTARECGSYS